MNNQQDGWFARARLKQQAAKQPRDVTPWSPDCPYCEDRGFVLVGFYDEPCPHCRTVCQYCGGHGTYVYIPDGADKASGITRYCRCDIGQVMQKDVFDKRYAQSKLPTKYQEFTFESFAERIASNPADGEGKEKAFLAVQAWCISIASGNNGYVDYHDIDPAVPAGQDVRNCIVLWGPPGVGKTGLVASALNYISPRGLPMRYIRAQAMIGAIQARFGDEGEIKYPNDGFGDMSAAQVKELLRTTPIQALDEMDMPDAKRDNKQAIMEEWSRGRTAEGLPTLITTNLDYDELEERWSTTTMSVLGAAAHFIHMDGPVIRAQPRRD